MRLLNFEHTKIYFVLYLYCEVYYTMSELEGTSFDLLSHEVCQLHFTYLKFSKLMLAINTTHTYAFVQL